MKISHWNSLILIGLLLVITACWGGAGADSDNSDDTELQNSTEQVDIDAKNINPDNATDSSENTYTSDCEHTCVSSVVECTSQGGSVVGGLCEDDGYCCNPTRPDTNPSDTSVGGNCQYSCVGLMDCDLDQLVLDQSCGGITEICCNTVGSTDVDANGTCEYTCVSFLECGLNQLVQNQTCGGGLQVCCDTTGSTDGDADADADDNCEYSCVGFLECDIDNIVIEQSCNGITEICCNTSASSDGDVDSDIDADADDDACQHTCISSDQCSAQGGTMVDQACDGRRKVCCDLTDGFETEDEAESDDMSTEPPCEHACINRRNCEEPSIQHPDQLCEESRQICCEIIETAEDTDTDIDSDMDIETDSDTDSTEDTEPAPCPHTCDYNAAICDSLGGTVFPNGTCENPQMVCCEIP